MSADFHIQGANKRRYLSPPLCRPRSLWPWLLLALLAATVAAAMKGTP